MQKRIKDGFLQKSLNFPFLSSVNKYTYCAIREHKGNQMSEENKMAIKEHYKELKECQKILRELKRSADTNGTYNPYNIVYPYQAKIVHQIREILRQKIEEVSTKD